MAYVSKEKKQKIAAALKTVMPARCRPRFDQGCDYGKLPRRILATRGDRYLLLCPGRHGYGGCLAGTVYTPTELQLYADGNTRTIYEGRVTKQVLREHTATIAAHLGISEAEVALLRSDRTIEF